MKNRRLAMTGIVLVLAPLAAAAQALNIDYYTIGKSDQDAHHLAAGNASNEVQNTLGADGLPLLNTAGFGCSSDCFPTLGAPQDVLANGEITYWSPALNNGGAGGTSDVKLAGTASIDVLLNQPVSFVSHTGGFESALLTGTIGAAANESLSFSIGANEMAFAYLDGKLVCDLGGGAGSSARTCTTPGDLAPGRHSLEVFLADLSSVPTGVSITVLASGATAVPEPRTVALLAAGGLGLGLRRRTRHR